MKYRLKTKVTLGCLSVFGHYAEFEAENDEEAMKRANKIVEEKNEGLKDVRYSVDEIQKIIFST